MRVAQRERAALDGVGVVSQLHTYGLDRVGEDASGVSLPSVRGVGRLHVPKRRRHRFDEAPEHPERFRRVCYHVFHRGVGALARVGNRWHLPTLSRNRRRITVRKSHLAAAKSPGRCRSMSADRVGVRSFSRPLPAAGVSRPGSPARTRRPASPRARAGRAWGRGGGRRGFRSGPDERSGRIGRAGLKTDQHGRAPFDRAVPPRSAPRPTAAARAEASRYRRAARPPRARRVGCGHRMPRSGPTAAEEGGVAVARRTRHHHRTDLPGTCGAVEGRISARPVGSSCRIADRGSNPRAPARQRNGGMSWGSPTRMK